MSKAWSIRRRLSWLLLFSAGTLLVLAAFGFQRLTAFWLQQEFDEALQAKARALVTLTTQDAREVDLDFADEYMPEFEAEVEPEYFQLWLTDGMLIERSNSLLELDLPRQLDLAVEARFQDLSLPDKRNGRLVQIDFVPQVEDDGEEDIDVPLDPRTLSAESSYRAATLVVAKSREGLDERLSTLSLFLSAFCVVLLGAIGFMIRVVLRLGFQPLDRLGIQVRNLDAETLDQRLEVPSPPEELEPMVLQLNELLERLEAAFLRERRLSSNLAHELRTPIAELRSIAEIGGRWPDDASTVERYFADVRTVALQMERNVVHLLALARYEGGLEAIDISRFRIAELISDCWRMASKNGARPGVGFEMDSDGDLEVETDRGKLELMLINLLSNALAYGTTGHSISCRITRGSEGVCLSIANHTEQLDSEDLQSLFDRFWRKDSARTGGQHAGLGLTLVRAFADLLKIKLQTELTPNRYFVISLTIPDAMNTDGTQ